MTTGSFGNTKSVSNASDLRADSYYLLRCPGQPGAHEQPELGRFIGMSDEGAAFVILDNLVRQDLALENITVKDDAIPRVVFEIEGES